jgi:hypothetical protein
MQQKNLAEKNSKRNPADPERIYRAMKRRADELDS